MFRLPVFTSCLLAAWIVLLPGPVSAKIEWTQHSLFTNNASIRIARRSGTTLRQATIRVKQETGGRILSSKTIKTKSGAVHRIKVLLPNGKVRIIQINAN